MARNWAICIGINDYYNLKPLKYAQRDAEAMRDFCLNEARFEKAYFFAEGSPSIPSDYGPPLRTEPNVGNLERFLEVRFNEPFLEAGDNLWFFFTGHGTRHQGRDYLMPIEVSNNKTGAVTLVSLAERLTAPLSILLFEDGVGIGEPCPPYRFAECLTTLYREFKQHIRIPPFLAVSPS